MMPNAIITDLVFSTESSLFGFFCWHHLVSLVINILSICCTLFNLFYLIVLYLDYENMAHAILDIF
jgi:hypothetical protein